MNSNGGRVALERVRDAFERGDMQEVRSWLERSTEVRALINDPLFSFGSPALLWAASNGHSELVEVLLEFGADPNRRSDWWAGGWHVLHSVRGSIADRLIEAGAVPDACGAANLDRVELLSRILNADPSRVHERGGDGQTPLHFARSREVIDLLLGHGADLDARDIDHRSTPAQWMLERRRNVGRYALAEYLVERGATPDIFLAAALGLTEHLRGMLAADPSLVQLRTSQGEYGEMPPSSYHIYTWSIGGNLSPLQVAAQFEQNDALAVMRQLATPVQRFLAACSSGDSGEARAILRERPALLQLLGPDDRRILPDAGSAGNAAAVELMLELGFDPSARGELGGTVLHWAAWEGAAACVEAVLRHSSAPELVNLREPTHESTPLGWCCHGACHRANPGGDYLAVAKLLLKAGAEPGPNLEDAPAEVRAVIDAWRKG